MAIATSPLRYPGGKTCLLDTVGSILKENNLMRRHYAEPYAGGCGLALALLYGGFVSNIHINDIDKGIWSFWHSILNDTESFISLMMATPVTMDEWYRQRNIQVAENISDPMALGFATFFLNRTNRSGIIAGAGVIGGYNQEGNYKLDCRFTKSTLTARIRRIKKYANRIHLHNLDALEFLDHVDQNLPINTFLCIDPPYFNKGSKLYTSFYKPDDHADLATRVMDLQRPWIITYDNADEIKGLYKTRRQFEFHLNYSAATKRVGTEIMIASKGLRMPEELRQQQIHKPQYRAA